MLLLRNWDVLIVGLVSALACVNPRRFRNVYRALAVFALCAVVMGAAYLWLTRPAAHWIATVFG
ncbi:hypothetical protein [Streptomyces sp. NPDC086782]|uniref:hypothetical protein n=1 Tax=Streptomyces sp. NPDC086782 TaxID=3365757 RepID=UPI0037F3EEDE